MANLRKPPIDYEKAFRYSKSFDVKLENGDRLSSTIEVDRFPDLVVPSGRIVAGDHAHVQTARPLSRKVKSKAYRVERISRRDTRQSHPGSYWYEVAGVRVLLSRFRPQSWKPAMAADKFASLLVSRTQELCLADAESMLEFRKRDLSLFDLMEDRTSLDFQLNADTGGNLIRSGLLGYGSGPRCAFWGLDRNGAPCRLVFDFGVLSQAVFAKKKIARVLDLTKRSVALKTRHGTLEASASLHKRGKELRVTVQGERIDNWYEFDFELESSSAVRMISSSGGLRGTQMVFVYEVLAAEFIADLMFAVNTKQERDR